jgi:Raf kinase inhibitor-like YbhB/YbcL family protein
MSMRRQRAGLVVAGALAASILLVSCSSKSAAHKRAAAEKGATMGFALKSPQWNAGDAIPQQFTCDGRDFSPALEWDGAPEGTKSFSLVTEDPDAPGGTFIHWVLYDLPADVRALPENLPKQKELPDGTRQGRNGFGRIGYGGPCPPPGPAHRYFFRLYALDKKLDLGAGASRAELDRAMKGHVLAQVELMGRYKRR